MDKRIWMVGLLAIVVIAGCSSSQSGTQAAAPPTTAATDASAATETTGARGGATPKPLEIVESGYSLVKGPRIEYAFVLRNPNSGFGVEFPVVRVTMRDAFGTVLNTSDLTFRRWLMPGETATIAGEADPKSTGLAKVDFEVVDPGAKWRTAGEAQSMGLGFLKTANLEVKRAASGTTFAVEVENPNLASIDDPAVSFVLRDKSGRIVAGYTDVGEELGPESNQIFTLQLGSDVPTFATVEAYAQPWGD